MLPSFSYVTALAGCLEAGTKQILFFLLRCVPRVMFSVERQLPPLRSPQPRPFVEVISSSHLFHEKTLPRLVARLSLLRVSLRGEALSKSKWNAEPGGSWKRWVQGRLAQDLAVT